VTQTCSRTAVRGRQAVPSWKPLPADPTLRLAAAAAAAISFQKNSSSNPESTILLCSHVISAARGSFRLVAVTHTSPRALSSLLFFFLDSRAGSTLSAPATSRSFSSPSPSGSKLAKPSLLLQQVEEAKGRLLHRRRG